jgi:hypothetical protein
MSEDSESISHYEASVVSGAPKAKMGNISSVLSKMNKLKIT